MCLAVPGKVVAIDRSNPNSLIGKVDFGGIAKTVSLDFVPDVLEGEYVIVHVGFALSKVNEEEAQKVFEYLKEMGELLELSEGKAPSDSAVPENRS